MHRNKAAMQTTPAILQYRLPELDNHSTVEAARKNTKGVRYRFKRPPNG